MDPVKILFEKDAQLLWIEAGANATPAMFDHTYPLPGVALIEPWHNLNGAIQRASEVVAPDRTTVNPWILAGAVLYSPDDIHDLDCLRPSESGRFAS